MRILYLDLDALTPSHLSCYGYHRQTSPTIDRLAAEGLRCTNTYCSDAPCLPSRTAFYSGRLGIQTGVVGHGGTAAQPKIEGPTRGFNDMFQQQGLAGRLQKAGLHTAMISPFGQRHAAWQFYAGFHEIHNTGK
ncbi:MAG: sulfatase-like hydrolase/transferase, partial [Phycisphaeraceae bacterium]